MLSSVDPPAHPRLIASGWLWLLPISLVACSPALDWRDVRSDDTGLMAQMPCRPTEHARQVRVGEHPRKVKMLSCQASDATWAVAWTEGVPPHDVGPTLAALRQAALANIQASAAEAPVASSNVPGATAQAQAGRWRAVGRRPDGSAVTQELLFFARGQSVYQGTVLATRPLAAESVDEFFGAMRFAP